MHYSFANCNYFCPHNHERSRSNNQKGKAKQTGMKIKNKGKVHPSPSPSSSISGGDVLSVLKLLPAAILTLASVLSVEDREVLAYMITRSINTTPTPSVVQNPKKKSSNKSISTGSIHKPPLFDCDCFDCYTGFWFRWDSSPNRELIHQVIEAFEDHLTSGENSRRNGGRTKKKGEMGRRSAEKPVFVSSQSEARAPDSPLLAIDESNSTVNDMSLGEASQAVLSDEAEVGNMNAEAVREEIQADGTSEAVGVVDEELATAVRTASASNHKALARKVLPDVLGLFNSRLWSLWSPNV